MSVIKRFLHYISATGLSLSLFFLATITVLLLTILNAGFIKQTLVKTNAYNNIIPASLELATATSEKQGEEPINPVVVSQLKPIATATVTPEFLKSSTESVIDGLFSWLDGRTTAPVILIKTDTIKQNLQRELVAYTKNRVATLEVCQKGTNYTNFDPLTTPCRPPYSVNEADIQSYVANLVSQIPLFSKPEISLESLGATDVFSADKPIQAAPKVYSVIQKLPYALLLLAVLSATVLVLIGAYKKGAVRAVAHTITWAGIMLVILSAITLIFNNRFSGNLLGSSTQEQALFVKTIVTPITNMFIKTAADYSLYIGIAYCLIGAILYVIAHRMRFNKLAEAANDDQVPLSTESKQNPPN